jgi:integration host factor subunit beta
MRLLSLYAGMMMLYFGYCDTSVAFQRVPLNRRPDHDARLSTSYTRFGAFRGQFSLSSLSGKLRPQKASIPHISLFFMRTGGEFGYAVCGGLDEMTKADLVEKVTRLGDLTRRDGEIIVETIFNSVITALQGGDKIEIRGFGSFRIRQRNPRIGRNPKTGERVEVPAKRVPYFKPSKELRDLVNPEEAAKTS